MKPIIPDAALNQHIAVLGKTGSGKSSAMRVLVEGLLDQNKPVCIVDPKGDWWGLKSSASGKKEGYPIIIFGGEHADVPINAHSGSAIAELISTGNRPCIIDLGGWMVGERTRFFIDFASSLFRSTKGLRWLVIDECHNFVPQGKVLDPDAGKMLHWGNRLASEGRGKGIQIIAASQRPQKVHKDFLTSCETLIAMRVIHPLDRNAIKDWIDGCPDAEKGRQVLLSLASMPRGTGWVWSPEIGFGPKEIAFPMFRTYDSFKAPTGEEVKLKGWASIDLDDVKAKLSEVVAEAEANDPKLLKKRIADLERELAKPTELVMDANLLQREKALSFKSGEIIGWNMAIDNIVLPSKKEEIEQRITEVKREVVQVRKPLSYRQDNSTISLGERLILTAVAQHGGCSREHLTIISGYKRSSRDAYIQRLREKGYVTNDGTRINITPEGEMALGSSWEPLPVGRELQSHWLQKLPEGERKLFAIIVEKYPHSVPRDSLDDESGYKRSSRDAYLQRLKTRELIRVVGRGEVIASDHLFN